MTREDMEFFENLFRSLETEMRAGFAAVKVEFGEVNARFDGVDARLDAQAVRLDRIGGLVNGGGRALSRLIEWSEKTDVSTENLTRRMADIEQRLRKLEKGPGE